MTATRKIETMRHVRPGVLLDLVAGQPVSVPMPGRGQNYLLETYLLIAAARLVKAKKIFEFGTFKAHTTLNLARNTEAEVYTLDLNGAPRTLDQFGNFGPYAVRAVRFLVGDSRTFNYSSFVGSMEFVFVDGCHDYDTVLSDTVNAFRLLKPDGPAVVAWHDYGNPEFPDVAGYLDNSGLHDLVHVEESRLAFWFREGLPNV
jgi:SAM-dependent methyltransferase